MAITDELRGWWVRTFPVMDKELHEEFTAIAHNIDAEHERATSEFWQKINAVPVTDENMAEYGWIRLPKDADGEPWHIGDRTESRQTVKAMGLNEYGWYFVGNLHEIDPSIHRHYHKPTIEDVLREFGDWYAHTKGGCDEDGIVADYAAKLREMLAGDAE